MLLLSMRSARIGFQVPRVGAGAGRSGTRATGDLGDGDSGADPPGDDKCIFVHLDFPTVDAAERFKAFLESVVWQSRDLSPGLAGTPHARVLREVGPPA